MGSRRTDRQLTGLEIADMRIRVPNSVARGPPTKIAGRYLSPYLAARQEADAVGDTQQPDGQPVDLDLELEVPSVADALRQARLRGEDERARLRQRRAEAFREARPPS